MKPTMHTHLITHTYTYINIIMSYLFASIAQWNYNLNAEKKKWRNKIEWYSFVCVRWSKSNSFYAKPLTVWMSVSFEKENVNNSRIIEKVTAKKNKCVLINLVCYYLVWYNYLRHCRRHGFTMIFSSVATNDKIILSTEANASAFNCSAFIRAMNMKNCYWYLDYNG